MGKYPSGITVITPTGGRPASFELCSRFMGRQTYEGAFQWIIVDDFRTATILPFWVSNVIRPEPFWKHGDNTLARNILCALPHVKYNRTIIVEDDDWYSMEYLEKMAEGLKLAEAVGCALTRYYHFPSRQYRVYPHHGRSSLCTTGFLTDSLLPVMKAVCEESPDWIDLRFWEAVRAHGLSARFLTGEPLCIGMKGLDGREGIGSGHRPQNDGSWKPDPELKVLHSWIGNQVSLYTGVPDGEELYGRRVRV